MTKPKATHKVVHLVLEGSTRTWARTACGRGVTLTTRYNDYPANVTCKVCLSAKQRT
jgi:hypothetical protein